MRLAANHQGLCVVIVANFVETEIFWLILTNISHVDFDQNYPSWLNLNLNVNWLNSLNFPWEGGSTDGTY